MKQDLSRSFISGKAICYLCLCVQISPGGASLRRHFLFGVATCADRCTSKALLSEKLWITMGKLDEHRKETLSQQALSTWKCRKMMSEI